MKKHMISTHAAFWIAWVQLFFAMMFGTQFPMGIIGAILTCILLDVFGQDIEFPEESNSEDNKAKQDDTSESLSTRETVAHKH